DVVSGGGATTADNHDHPAADRYTPRPAGSDARGAGPVRVRLGRTGGVSGPARTEARPRHGRQGDGARTERSGPTGGAATGLRKDPQEESGVGRERDPGRAAGTGDE